VPSPRPTLPFLLVLALGAAPAPGQQTPDTDFSQATRPVVRITDPSVIETLLFELFIEPAAPPARLELIDLTQNGFGPQDILIAQPSGEAFLVPEFLPPEIRALMSSWQPDVEYRVDSGNIPLEALAALAATETDDGRRAESAILYDVVEAVERSYRDLPVGILFLRDSLGFTFQLWDYNRDAMEYTPKVGGEMDDSTVVTVVEMLRDIGYAPGRTEVGTGQSLSTAGIALAPVDQTLFGIGGVADEQVRILAARTVLLGSYDFDRSGALDTAREIDAPGCEVWQVLESGFPGFLRRFGFSDTRAPYIGGVVFSIAENVRVPASRRASACLEGLDPPVTDSADVRAAPLAGGAAIPDRVDEFAARVAATALFRAVGGSPPGSGAWSDGVRGVLLRHFDADGSEALDTPHEVQTIPCLVWQSVAATHGSFASELGFSSEEGFVGDRIGVDPSQRAVARALIQGCVGQGFQTSPAVVRPRMASSSGLDRWGAPTPVLTTSLQAIHDIPEEERRQLAAKTLILAFFDADGSGAIDTSAELTTTPCEVWTSMEVAFPDYGGRFGITDRSRPYLGNVLFSVAPEFRDAWAARITACLAGDEPPDVPDMVMPGRATVVEIPVQVREFLDADAARRIFLEAEHVAAGSAGWTDAVREVLLEEYDSDGSGLVDREEEVGQVPCVVWNTIRATSGGSLAPMGFGTRGDYYGDRIGIGEGMRASATRALEGCRAG
jgi:hypothetical protein